MQPPSAWAGIALCYSGLLVLQVSGGQLYFQQGRPGSSDEHDQEGQLLCNLSVVLTWTTFIVFFPPTCLSTCTPPKHRGSTSLQS